MLNLHNPGCLSLMEFGNYEMSLAHAFYDINQRGIAVDPQRLSNLRLFIHDELQRSCGRISTNASGKSVIASNPILPSGKKAKQPPNTLNLSSPDQVIDLLKACNLKIPLKRHFGKESTETTDEEALNSLFAETGHPILKDILRVRELNKILGTYVNAEIEDNILYGAYFVTGTVTGRRSCRENFLGLGTNLQNQPKHSDLGKRFRECLVARSGKIFIECDQSSAEDWIIQAIIADLTGNDSGIQDLIKGGRHEKLACFIFSIPLDQVRYDVERYLAKKVRYAGSYDMGGNRFSSVMAEEGFVVPEDKTTWLLAQFHSFEPQIRGVFQQFIKDELTQKRQLINPFGRVRQFFALRDYADNKKVFKEGYANIPQSTVGDNTGMSILCLETDLPQCVLADGHDSIVLEVDDDIRSISMSIDGLQESFRRVIRFRNGYEVTIPIDIQLGYDLEHVTKCGNLTKAGLINTYQSLKKPPKAPIGITSGQERQLLGQH